MSEFTPGLEDLLDAHFSSRLEGVRGPMPGVIMTYNPATQEADVALLFDVDSTTGVAVTLKDVPVQFPGYSGRAVTFPLYPGDPVLCVPAEADISGWRLTGDATKASTSRFDISDVVAFPTLRTKLGPLSVGDVDAAATVVSGTLVKLGSSTASSFVSLATPNDANWSAFTTWAMDIQAKLTAPPVVPWGLTTASPTTATKVMGE